MEGGRERKERGSVDGRCSPKREQVNPATVVVPRTGGGGAIGDSRQPNRHRAPNDAQPLRHAGEKIAEIRGLIGDSLFIAGRPDLPYLQRYLSPPLSLSLSLLDLYSIRSEWRVESFVTISSTAQLNGLDLSERLTSSFFLRSTRRFSRFEGRDTRVRLRLTDRGRGNVINRNAIERKYINSRTDGWTVASFIYIYTHIYIYTYIFDERAPG